MRYSNKEKEENRGQLEEIFILSKIDLDFVGIPPTNGFLKSLGNL